MNDAPAAASGPSETLPPAAAPEHITGDIRRRFCDLPGEISKRREAERRNKQDRQNAQRLLHMKTVYWKKNKRLTVPCTLPEWERLTRFAEQQGQPPTTAFRQAAFARIGQAEQDPAFPAAAAQEKARRADPRGQAARSGADTLARCAGRIATAIDRIGVNINQCVRHIHTNKNAAFSELRACHNLLQGLKQDVLGALTAELPPAGERAS